MRETYTAFVNDVARKSWSRVAELISEIDEWSPDVARLSLRARPDVRLR
jgi:hypothetical protein